MSEEKVKILHLITTTKELDNVFDLSPDVKKYRELPVVIQALKVDRSVVIPTLEGDLKASPGDYIIKGINGEYYPCKSEIFEKTYALTNSAETSNEER